MFEFIYRAIGLLMLIWYGTIRWTMFADKTRYAWAYAPINMTTAFLSVVFLIPSLFMPTINNAYMLGIAIFLLIRNIYYTIEDIIDYPTNPKMQLFFIVLDLLMAIYVTFWIKNL